MELLHMCLQILGILASITSIKTQCLGKSDCVSHCGWFFAGLCICDYGWGGSADNKCQKKNVAYQATAASSSTDDSVTLRSSGPENAVDGRTGTAAITKSGKNPWLSVTLSEFLNVSRISVYLDMDFSEKYEVYVTDSSLTTIPNNHLCGSVSTTTRERNWMTVKCSNGRILTGNRIVLQKITDRGKLIVYEIQTFKCSQGTYGPECENECRKCQDNRCNENTGVCEIGCNSGWYGDKCDKKCPPRCASSSCDRYRGCTYCLDVGYSGPNCDPCSGNTYGRNCIMTCQNCRDCDRITGCQDCDAGFHGTDCTDTCEQGCKTASCEKNSGNCVDGCKNGYMGLTCAEPCRDNCATCNTTNLCSSCVSGKFGIQCENDCPESCGGNNRCNKNSGNCLQCIPSRFGPNCTEVCSNNCIRSSACLRNGDCTNGCVAGWIGSRCDTQCSVTNCEKCIESSGQVSCEICNDGYFLDNTGGCQKYPSNCVSCESDSKCTQCISGFKGTHCKEHCHTNCIDGLCKIDGTCTHGCNNSMYGIGCKTPCIDTCLHCLEEDTCTKCSPGYFERYCFECGTNCYNCTRYAVCESCKAGFHGTYCSKHCPEGCETCASQDRCSSCKKGWSGSLCQCQENCEQEPCGENGKCLSGCRDSFYGDYCNVTCPLLRCQKCDQSSGICKVFLDMKNAC